MWTRRAATAPKSSSPPTCARPSPKWPTTSARLGLHSSLRRSRCDRRQGTIGLEILEDVPQATDIIVSVGGGGLIGGIATAVKTLKPAVRVWGVETEGADCMSKSLAAGEIVTLDAITSVARTLGAPRRRNGPWRWRGICSKASPWCRMRGAGGAAFYPGALEDFDGARGLLHAAEPIACAISFRRRSTSCWYCAAAICRSRIWPYLKSACRTVRPRGGMSGLRPLPLRRLPPDVCPLFDLPRPSPSSATPPESARARRISSASALAEKPFGPEQRKNVAQRHHRIQHAQVALLQADYEEYHEIRYPATPACSFQLVASAGIESLRFFARLSTRRLPGSR